jgi:hypothetical protein
VTFIFVRIVCIVDITATSDAGPWRPPNPGWRQVAGAAVCQSNATGQTGEGSRLDEIKEWEKDVPADLRPAVAHLRESFDEVHFACSETTRRFCYAALHDEPPYDPTREYFLYLMAMRRGLGSLGSQRFAELAYSKVPPAIFKAYFDLYVEWMSAKALTILSDLVAIGRANEERLGTSALPWAEGQARHLIRSHRQDIQSWVQAVCDGQVHSRGDDPEEILFGRKWRAPSLIIMVPSRYQPYEADKAWDRNPPETSAKWLESFADDYVRHLEGKVKKFLGMAMLESAKQPPARQPSALQQSTPTPNHPEMGTRVSTPPQPTPNAIRREARKLETDAKYRRWQAEYRRLKRRRKGMSDVWYSQQIASMPIADGSSAETIRKQMTEK